jgi:predicted transcriptional regulator
MPPQTTQTAYRKRLNTAGEQISIRRYEMARPRKKVTNVTRVLEALSEKSQTTQELADTLKLPLGTARSTVSFLTRAGLTKPEEIRRVAKPFTITEKGKEQLKQLQQEAT